MYDIEAPLYEISAAQHDGIQETLIQVLTEEPDVAFAFVHGSFAAGGPFHDIDVAVYFRGRSSDDASRRALALSEALEDALTRWFEAGARPFVDVRVLNAAPLGFCYQVLRNGELLANRDDALRTDWTVRIWSQYLDTKPLRDRALKEAMTSWH